MVEVDYPVLRATGAIRVFYKLVHPVHLNISDKDVAKFGLIFLSLEILNIRLLYLF